MLSSPVIRWRNFRLTPLELLIIVLTILGIVFLVSTWNKGGAENGQQAPANAVMWEQTVAASEQTAQLLEQMREEIKDLNLGLQSLEQRLNRLERASGQLGPAATYTVKEGDTLSSIAKAHNISIIDLRAWNKLAPQSLLKPGQSLSLAPAD